MKLYGSPQTREKQSFSVSAPLQNTANLSPVKTSKYDNRAEQCEITWENITVVRYDEGGGEREAKWTSSRKAADSHSPIYLPGILILRVKISASKRLFSLYIAHPGLYMHLESLKEILVAHSCI